MNSEKHKSTESDDDDDTLFAFMAMGGERDRTGLIIVEKLRQTIDEFQMTIDIDALVEQIDKDKSGTINYDEFKELLSEDPERKSFENFRKSYLQSPESIM